VGDVRSAMGPAGSIKTGLDHRITDYIAAYGRQQLELEPGAVGSNCRVCGGTLFSVSSRPTARRFPAGFSLCRNQSTGPLVYEHIFAGALAGG
jgi:hypothetical protein